MTFLKKMTEWAEHQSFNKPVNTNAEAIQLLTEIVERLQTDMDAFYEIVQVETKPQSEVVDLAKMLQLLNHENDAFQEQGIQLFLTEE